LGPLKACNEGQRCDTTTAISGETALLFLTPLSEKPFRDGWKDKEKQFALARQKELKDISLYNVVHSGYGRMPIKSWGGKEYVRRSGLVLLPKMAINYDPTLLPRQERKHYFLLETFISHILKTPALNSKTPSGDNG
jgi:hypothetical protein